MLTEDRVKIEAFLKGDENAFSWLVKKYTKPIYNFVYQLTKDASISQDLTQDTFLKAWKNIKRFDSKKSFKTWLYVIAKNTTYDYFKKKKSLPFSFFEDEEGYSKLENLSEDKPLPDEVLNRKDIEQELANKLKKIPEADQTLLLMHYKEDLSLAQIAEILSEPYNTVKSRHQRALAKLKKVLTDDK